MPPEVLGIIGAYANDTLKKVLPNMPSSSGEVNDLTRAAQDAWQGFENYLQKHSDSFDLVNDLTIAKQNAWQGFSDYLRGHPNSFSGKIFIPLIGQNGNNANEQIVQNTFLEAQKKIKQNYQILLQAQKNHQIQILPVQGLDPENLETAEWAFERIDNIIAEEYLPRCEKCIIQSIKENRRELPETNPQFKIVDYLKQLERAELLDAKILVNAFVYAVSLDHLDCLNAIIQSNRFAEISSADLGWALDATAKNGHLDCLFAIIRSKRFAEISSEDLKGALRSAALNGHLDCYNAICSVLDSQQLNFQIKS